jgi:serine/threonine-protein kinase
MSLVGHRIGRYRILEKVGSGGMSVVYKGLDTALDREVAVKVLHPHLAGKEDSRRRLAREAQAVAKLQHPNILEVFDFVSGDSETAYIVTEFIRGQTLKHYAEKRAFYPPEIAAMVIHEVAEALAHAHDLGIIHRDLKPENVMVREDGVIKLMDFGIAKFLDREDQMTMTGALVGSPAHMAPEIIEGHHQIGPEADVFSLGTMLYYFSTGQLPFAGANATATLKKILDGNFEDPRKLSPAVSDGLAEVISTSLARQLSIRYPNARRLQQALAQYLASAGFARPGDELGWFFLDPVAYRAQMLDRLVDNRLQLAQRLAGANQLAKALSCLNQVLALDAGNAKAKQLLATMNRTRHRRNMLRRGLAVTGSSAAIIALCTGAFIWRERAVQSQVALASTPARPAPVDATLAEPTPTEALAVSSIEPLGGAARPTTGARVQSRTTPGSKKSAENAKLTLIFRPYGYAQIDGGERQPETPQHEFQLAPGPHRLVYGCRFCEEETTTINVAASGETLRLRVQPKPSRLLFHYDPPDAEVRLVDDEARLGGKTKIAAETQGSPFEVFFKRGDPKQTVSYEITRSGFKSRRDQVTLVPGESKILEGRLEPE